MTTPSIPAASVHEVLGRHMLADGYDMVLDMEKSHGRRLYDARPAMVTALTKEYFAHNKVKMIDGSDPKF